MSSYVKNAICCDGVYAEVLLYALFHEHNRKVTLFEIDGYIYVQPIKPYPLIDDFGYLNNCKLDLYAIKLTDFPKNFEGYLEACFGRLADLGASAYWAMFDSVFAYDHLLTADVSNQIYGFGLKGQSCQIAVQDDVIMGAAWTKKVQGFRDSLIDMKLINLSPTSANI